MTLKTAARAASAINSLEEWRSMGVHRSFCIRAFNGPRGALWQVDLWTMRGAEAVGVIDVSGELAGAVRGAMEKAEKERLP